MKVAINGRVVLAEVFRYGAKFFIIIKGVRTEVQQGSNGLWFVVEALTPSPA